MPPLPAAADTHAQALGKLITTLLVGLDPEVRRYVMPVARESAAVAEEKWRRAVTESIGSLQERVAGEVDAAPAGLQKFAATVGDGYSSSFTLTHNLGTQDVVVQVRRTSDNAIGTYAAAIRPLSPETVMLTFSVPPSSGQYRVVVVG